MYFLSETNDVKENIIEEAPATQLFVSDFHKNLILEKEKFISTCCSTFISQNELKLNYIVVSKLVSSNFINIEGDDFKQIMNSSSDLIPGIYEGGFKIWECTFDLINYLENNQIKFKDKIVLDLGCGAGLLGQFSMKKESGEVIFQDYNKEVINYLTIPNVLINIQNMDIILKSKYFSGDWSSFSDKMQSEDTKFDLILSSETIYNVQNIPKLLNLIIICMSTSGEFYLSAKTLYFGVGGGINALTNLIDNEFKSLKWETVKEFSEGVNRQILKITFK